jgi:phasin family protein
LIPKGKAPSPAFARTKEWKIIFVAVQHFFGYSAFIHPVANQYQEPTMPINLEQLAASNKAAVDSLLAVANTALASAERIAALNLGAARAALDDTSSAAKAAMAVKSPTEAVALQTSALKPAVEKAVDYSRSLYEISSESQKQLAKMVEAQFADFQKNVSSMVAQATKSAPAGSETIMAAMQSAVAAANSAFANMTAMTKQLTETAQANMAAATKKK